MKKQMVLALPSGSWDCGPVWIGVQEGEERLPLLGSEGLPSSQCDTLSSQPGQQGWAAHPHPHPGCHLERPSPQELMTERGPLTQGKVTEGNLGTWVVVQTCQDSDISSARPHSGGTGQRFQAQPPSPRHSSSAGGGSRGAGKGQRHGFCYKDVPGGGQA